MRLQLRSGDAKLFPLSLTAPCPSRHPARSVYHAGALAASLGVRSRRKRLAAVLAGTSVPVISSLGGHEGGGPSGLLGPEEGGSVLCRKRRSIGLQEDRGASHELQGTCGQERGRVRALGDSSGPPGAVKRSSHWKELWAER